MYNAALRERGNSGAGNEVSGEMHPKQLPATSRNRFVCSLREKED
jgi:hypothetical protein